MFKTKKSFHYLCYSVILFAFLTTSCSKKNNAAATPTQPPVVVNPDPELKPDDSTTSTISRTVKYQTIDGFGFFGAKGVWWENANNLYSDAWATQVIKDLGITIWRNEFYPPATPTVPQDADFNKQKATIMGLAKIAAQNKVDLKYIITVWSPPGSMKCLRDANNSYKPISGTVHPYGAKGGGGLDPAKYTEFGNWIADNIQLYKDLGINIYAISPQNEPLFEQPFNSCAYNPDVYPEMIKGVIPTVKARFPAVKVFGSENMLEMEGGNSREYFYNSYLKKDANAFSKIDILAIHGYSDGISPTGSSELARLWNNTKTEMSIPSGKPYWMTETSGYTEDWLGNPTKKSGALSLGLDIHAALYNGNASAWVWWQGSSNGTGIIDDFSLMNGVDKKGKKYYVSKHFYRFIRPGAKMVKVEYEEQKDVFTSAFENTAMSSFTVVLINNSNKIVKVKLAGSDVPSEFDFYLTTEKSSENCIKRVNKVKKDNVILPAKSIVTLVNGNVFE